MDKRLHQWRDFLVTTIKSLRSPFHNRLAWLVVIGGLAMSTARWWEPLLWATVAKLSGDDQLVVPDSNLGPWGVLLCALGLLYHGIVNYAAESITRKQQSLSAYRKHRHDRRAFKDAEAFMTELDLITFIDHLETDHSYRLPKLRRIEEFAYRLIAEETRLVTPSLDALATNFHEAIQKLGSFLSFKFFVFPLNQIGDDTRLCMQPCWNPDREWNGDVEGLKKYDQLEDELLTLTSSVKSAYQALRRAVKEELLI